MSVEIGKPSVEDLKIYSFPKGAFIYPEKSYPGILQFDARATKLTDLAGKPVKIKKYVGWKSIGRMVVYYDNHTWVLPGGTFFGAPSKIAKKTKT